MLVVTAYLLYTLYEADYELRRAGSFYADLGLPLSATEREIKSRFRRLAAQYHPDKTDNSAEATAYFVHLKSAADTLTDPARRFAYERFGPDSAGWAHCATVRDFVGRGAQTTLAYYGVAAAAMYALGLLGYLDWGRYERWLVLLSVCVFELHTVTRPTPPALFTRLVNPVLAWAAGRPPYLPFQAISLARKVAVTLYIGFSQIGPLLAASTAGGQVVVGAANKGDDEAALRAGLDRLEAMARGLDTDAARLLEMELSPFAGDPAVMGSVRGKIKEWLVQNTIRSDPMVKDALGRSFQKRRIDAPSGARGNR